MFQNVNNLIEREEWMRMPIPENYQIQEMTDPLSMFPKNFKQMIKMFNKVSLQEEKENIKKVENKSKNHFSSFALDNPFSKLQIYSSINDKDLIKP